MATSKLALYNGALLIVGERALQGLTEARESRRLLDSAWTDAIDHCLDQGLWNFASRSVELEFSPSIESQFGYQYVFTRPDDFVKTVAMCQDERFDIPLLRYETEGPYFFADANPIYLRYVSNGTSYGADLSLWPANFTAFAKAYLAHAIVSRLTQDQNEWKRVRALMDKALLDAKSSDAMEQPSASLPRGTWSRSRGGSGGGGDRGSRNRLIG